MDNNKKKNKTKKLKKRKEIIKSQMNKENLFVLTFLLISAKYLSENTISSF